MLQIQLLYVHDYVSFFAPYWNPSIKGYGTPYQFQFFNVLGKAVCQYKQFSEEGLKWLPIAPQFGILTVEQLYKENVTIIEDQLSLASKEGKHAFMKHLRIEQDSNNSSSNIADAFVENKDNIRDNAGIFQKAFPLLRDSVSVKGLLEQDLRREDESNGINYIERYEVKSMAGAQATLQMQNTKEHGIYMLI